MKTAEEILDTKLSFSSALPIIGVTKNLVLSAMEEYAKQNVVYEFWYNDCIFESAAACISIHRTRKGAEMALAFHKEQKRKEWDKMNEGDEQDGEFDDMCAWGIQEREVLE